MFQLTCRRIIFTLFIVFVTQGCSINKRYHNTGFNIQWNWHAKSNTDNPKIGLGSKKRTEPTSHFQSNQIAFKETSLCSEVKSTEKSATQMVSKLNPKTSKHTQSSTSRYYNQIKHPKAISKIDFCGFKDSTDKPLRRIEMHQNAPRNATWSLIFALLGFTIFGMFLSPIAIYLGIKSYYQGVTYKNGLIRAIVGVLLGLFFLVIITLILSTPWGG
jgi:hypothetical protein